MRVGLVIYSSLDSISGGYLYDRQLVENLRRAGDTVEIFSLPWRNYMRHLLDNLSRELRDRLEQAELDVLLQDELNHPSLFYVNRCMRGRLAFPLVTIVHHLRSSEGHAGWLRRLYRTVERWYFGTLDGMICNSLATRQAVNRLGRQVEGIPGIVAVPAGDHIGKGVSEEEIRQRSLSRAALRLLYVGNVIPRKGLLLLLQALAGMEPGSWTLKAAGSLEADRRYAEQVMRQADEPGLRGQVELCGSLSAGDLLKAYATSQVLVLPSQYEGYGIAYLEGMAFGLPGIGTHAGAAAEIISDGQNGLLIQPGSLAELRDALHRLAGDRELLLRLSLAARKRFLAQPTWAESGARTRKFLVSLVEEGRLR